MPYRKYKSRKPSTRTRWKRRGASTASMAYSAYKGMKYLKGMVNAELKKHVLVHNETVGTAGQVYHLNGIAQGDTNLQRNGNSILGRWLFGRALIVQHANAVNTFVRYLIVQDKQQIGDTTPNTANVLQSISILSSLNVNESRRFKILKDGLVKFDAPTGTNGQSKVIKFNIDTKSHVKYNGTASTDIQKNGLYLILISNETTNTPTWDSNLTFNFYDN